MEEDILRSLDGRGPAEAAVHLGIHGVLERIGSPRDRETLVKVLLMYNEAVSVLCRRSGIELEEIAKSGVNFIDAARKRKRD